MTTRDASAREGWRGTVAIAICVLSATAGAVAIALGSHHVARDIGWMGVAWALTSDWLGRRFRLLRKTPGQIYRDARQGRLRRSSLEKTIDLGSVLFFVTAIACFFR
ncbi:MAG: hypothetical protein ACRETZ_09995 [Steroidobacteraceae bacterium]